jgi:glycine cleavage system aminomethyltransferase T
MAFVQRDFVEPGTEVSVYSGGREIPATVTGLPPAI